MEKNKQPLFGPKIKKKNKINFRRLAKRLKLDSLKHKENSVQLNQKINEMEKKLNEISSFKLMSDVKFFFICRLFIINEPATICVEINKIFNIIPIEEEIIEWISEFNSEHKHLNFLNADIKNLNFYAMSRSKLGVTINQILTELRKIFGSNAPSLGMLNTWITNKDDIINPTMENQLKEQIAPSLGILNSGTTKKDDTSNSTMENQNKEQNRIIVKLKETNLKLESELKNLKLIETDKLKEIEATNNNLRDENLRLKQELHNEKKNNEISSKLLQDELVAQNKFKDRLKEKEDIEFKLAKKNEEIFRLRKELETAKSESSKAFSYARMYVDKLKEFETMYIKVQAERRSLVGIENDNDNDIRIDFMDGMYPLSENRFVKIEKFNGTTLVSIREYYDRNGIKLPGKKGISLNIDQFNFLKKYIGRIEKDLKL